MLEIFFIIFFAKKLAEIAQSKGRPKGWAALGVVGWIVGEVLGGVVGALIFGDGAMLYLTALVGAAIGAGIAWAVVNGLTATSDSFEGIGDAHGYAHADPNNPFSPPGFGKRE